MTNLLYDHPGPRARLRNRLLSLVSGIALLGLFWGIYRAFDSTGQWTAEKWDPFLSASTWTDFILPGIGQTLLAAVTAMVLALAFGILFSVGRLSDHRWLSVPAGAVVEFFRAVPLLIMIFFISYGMFFVIGYQVPAFWSVVIGLTLYNGSVLAEAFRAGIRAVPKGQSEAAYGLGLRKQQVMRFILVPQAARSMLPVIVSQLVVVLKDTALGYIVAFPELMQQGSQLIANDNNTVPAYLVIAGIYILINGTLTLIAHTIEVRTRRLGTTRTSRPTAATPALDAGA